MDIDNRTVLIVGGTSGIGLGLARRFAAAGGTVIVGGRSAARVPRAGSALSFRGVAGTGGIPGAGRIVGL